MNTLMQNKITAEHIARITDHHMTDEKSANEIPLGRTLIAMLMDITPSHEQRTHLLATAFTAFVGESAPALKTFDSVDTNESIDVILEDVNGILAQVKERLINSPRFHKTLQATHDKHYATPENEETSATSEIEAALKHLLSSMAQESSKTKEGCGECIHCAAIAAAKAKQPKET